MRVIVPGGSGFIGRNLLSKAPPDWDIVAIYNTDRGFPAFVDELKSKRIVAEKCNLLKQRNLRSLRRKSGANYDLCIYLAANSDPSASYINPSSDLRSNTESLINFLLLFKVTRFIFFSSGAVYNGYRGIVSPDNRVAPTLPYAISKVASEAYVRHFQRKGAVSEYLIVRFFGAYGPHEPARKIYTRMVKQFYLERNNRFSIRGDGLNLVDAMYVDDTVEGILRMVNKPLEDTVIDFCRGAPITIRDLVLQGAKIFRLSQPTITQQGETAEYNRFYANPLPFKLRYGFTPNTGLEEGFYRLAKFLEDKLK